MRESNLRAELGAAEGAGLVMREEVAKAALKVAACHGIGHAIASRPGERGR